VRDRPPYEQSFVDVSFEAFLADPIGQARAIYAAAGDELTPEAEAILRHWGADNNKGKHGSHTYEAADFGFDLDDLYRRLGFYIEKFNIPCRFNKG
jgi:hypothetical protein